MDKLTKSQKDEFATAFAILALHDGGADVSTDQINALLEATGNTEVEAFYPIIFANFLSSPDKVSRIIAFPATGGGGGGGGAGGGGGGDAEEEEEEKVEEEEMEAPAADMFGGGDGGDY